MADGLEEARGGSVAIVVGNPSPASRTMAAATDLGQRVGRRLGLAEEAVVLDLAILGAGLLDWGDEAVSLAVDAVRGAGALVVASPTYKASFTGLVKLFLDRFDRDGLGGMPTVPMMMGGSPAHSLAVEVHLRPVLVEIGASCPTRGVYLSGEEIDDPRAALDEWEAAAAAVLDRLRGG